MDVLVLNIHAGSPSLRCGMVLISEAGSWCPPWSNTCALVPYSCHQRNWMGGSRCTVDHSSAEVDALLPCRGTISHARFNV